MWSVSEPMIGTALRRDDGCDAPFRCANEWDKHDG